ncbi:DcaP family trimeric outer membrane transporter [Neptunicella marina]|uniref:Porin n=1 Tax=Neptunicella marina TaxID=2125989 RepID=A0A8J6IUY5_9ALTE|nr:DcaP family trimeric outer membrane transporter [Neptunicella marina]MBC3766091.1 porin [Neptunicella marina]
MKLIRTTALTMAMAGLTAAPLTQADTTFKFSGYVKADGMWSTYSDGTLGSASAGRDFYIPAVTPAGGNDEASQFDAHAKQSRFRFTSSTDLENGETIQGVFEMDFMLAPGGDERISNSYQPRLRHAFIKYGNWMIGQTWSTFMDVGTLPESVDFIGSTDGTIFVRQTQVRYTNGAFQIALENPESTITPTGGGRVVADDNSIPDLTMKFTSKQDWGYFSVAGLLRQLSYVNKQGGANIDEDTSSYGISVASKIMLGQDDLRLMVNYGSGLGRYMGLNTNNGAVMTSNGDLEAIDSMGFTAAYRHVIDSQTRVNFIYARYDADDDAALQGMLVNESTWSTRANVMYSPTKAITVGAEFAHAKIEKASGAEGDMNRVQFMAKYAF